MCPKQVKDSEVSLFLCLVKHKKNCYFANRELTNKKVQFMKRRLLPLLTLLALFSIHASAETDVSALFLNNWGFDSDFNYTKSESGNVAQEILQVPGWEMDISIDYTITGVYEFGTKKTFNTYGVVPSEGYDGSAGCLALSTGWNQSLMYYQVVTLPAGTYTIKSAWYNGSNQTAGSSLVGWIPVFGEDVMSTITSFPIGQWTTDEQTFTLTRESDGLIQLGYKAGSNSSSSNSAKVVLDYVKLFMEDDAAALDLAKQRLSDVIKEATALYGDGSGAEAGTLLTAINGSQNILQSSTAAFDDMITAKMVLEAAMQAYKEANVSIENPLDWTHLITNPSFEDTSNGWTNENMSAQVNNSFKKKDGTYYMEKWRSSAGIGDALLSQNLVDLPVGIYILKAAAQNTLSNSNQAQTGAVIFAGDTEVVVSAADDYSLQFTNIDGTTTIGFRAVNASGNWLATDNFRLYYCGGDLNDYKAELQRRIESAEEMLQAVRNSNVANAMQTAIENAKTELSKETADGYPTVAKALSNAIAIAKESNDAYTALDAALAIAETAYDATKNEAEAFKSVIDNAKAIAQSTESSNNDLADAVKALTDAQMAFNIANATGKEPVVKTLAVIQGATRLFVRLNCTTSGLKELGFCWSTEPEPTIYDHRTTTYYSNNGNIYYADTDVNDATVYYVRAYAISSGYAVGYGDVMKVATLPKGTIRWSYDNGADAAANARINAAVKGAVDIWNSVTSIDGFSTSVHYGSGTPTADCSYGGWMRIGPNASYQAIGTVMHEMAHGIGVGTHNNWSNSSIYRENTSRGYWNGARVDRVLQFLENSSTARLTGDNTHMWPYGINGAQEDNHTMILYYANGLIVEALGEDNLPPTDGAFATPAYTFVQDDDTKYYIKNEGDNRGLKTSYLWMNNANRLRWMETTSEDAMSNDSCAWYIHYNPVTCYYTFTNAGTGRTITYSNNLSTSDNPNATAARFQLLPARATVKTGKYTFAAQSYWIVSPTSRNALCGNAAGSVGTVAFNHANSSNTQRWLIMTADEVKAFGEAIGDEAVSVKTPLANDEACLNVLGGKGNITVSANGKGQKLNVLSLDGRLIETIYVQSNSSAEINLPSGVYIIGNQKVVVR